MSSSNEKPPKNPFADDGVDLDDWDSAFDSLHAGSEGGTPAAEPVMQWPASEVPPTPPMPVTRAATVPPMPRAEPALGPHERPTARPLTPLPSLADDDDFGADPSELTVASELTLAGVAPPERTLHERPRWTEDPVTAADTIVPPVPPVHTDPADHETDFSVIGADSPPSALGPLLGRPPTAPLFDAEETRVQLPIPEVDEPLAEPEDDDPVFTSASRPTMPAPMRPGVDDVDAPIAPPPPTPVPLATVVTPPPTSAPAEPRRPAIIRRAVPSSSPKITPPEPYAQHIASAAASGAGSFGEATRVSSLADIEARAHAAAAAMPATPIPPEEDYADIDIEMVSDSAQPASAPVAPSAATASSSSAVARRTAHIVRRPDAAARAPANVVPAAARPLSSSAVSGEVGDRSEISNDQLTPRPGALPSAHDGEIDFSDVALAVGAVEDVPLPEEVSRAERPSQPRIPSVLGERKPGSGPVIKIPPRGAPTPNPTPPMLPSVLRTPAPQYPESDPTPLPAPVPGSRDSDSDSDLDSLDFEDPEPAKSPAASDSLGPLDDLLAELAPTAAPAAAPPPVARAQTGAIPPVARTQTGAIPPVARTQTGAIPPVARAQTGAIPPVATESARPPALADLYPPRVKTPTSVPPITGAPSLFPPAAALAKATATRRTAPTHVPAYIADAVAIVEPELDLDAIQLPMQLPPLTASDLDESCATELAIIERELETIDEAGISATLRTEAGRLCERLGENERARAHYDAALLADPRATPALRGLRRLARSAGDLAEATRQLDAELAVASALERRPLSHHRIDLLMASGDQGMARVAVGEVLDTAPSDVRALLAQLELAFLDGRADEFGSALEQLSHAVADAPLRAAVQSARAALAAHTNDTAGAARWFSAAAEADPTGMGARIAAVRHAAAAVDAESAARALVELARQFEQSDPPVAAAFALRAQQWVQVGDTAVAAAKLATQVAPADSVVARVAAEVAAAQPDPQPTAVGLAYAHWASTPSTEEARAYAAGRAAEVLPARAAALWTDALAHDPNDDYAAAQLRSAHAAADAIDRAIAVDLAIADDPTRDRARVRAAFGLVAQGKRDEAIALLAAGRIARPGSLAIAEALGEALASAGSWTARAQLFAELAAEPGAQLDRDVAELRSALAWEDAVSAATDASSDARAAGADATAATDLHTATTAALGAWERVLETAAGIGVPAPAAHAAAIVLATRLGDRAQLATVLARAQAAERTPWQASSLALRRARLVAASDPEQVAAIAREGDADGAGFDDPRFTVALTMAAARRKAPADAATALEERAGRLSARGNATEVAALRLRAAQLALDAGDATRATSLLGLVERALPGLGVVPDLLAAARRRAGDRPTATSASAASAASGEAARDQFARLLRDGDLALAHGDGPAALALYQRALELRPGDPLATVPLVRAATALREPAPLTALALAQLRSVEGDPVAKAVAYEQLARIDLELRDDAPSAQIALESAASTDPSRVDLLHRLARHYAAADQLPDLIRLRKAELAAIATAAGNGTDYARDIAALATDGATLASLEQRPDSEVASLYRTALAADPRIRLALLHLESTTRRAGGSAELADIEDRIAAYFEGDPRSQAAFWTRAGETLADIGQIAAAVQRFKKADAATPGSEFALEGWRHAALKGELWLDVAEAATRQANAARTTPEQRAALHHLAGVALMDKAMVGDAATQSLRRALAADPKHRDSFLRLRILLEEDANHDDLATLLAQRLEVEADPGAQVELHRALAELHRNFLSDRDTAKLHYRAILAHDQNDLRAHAAIADIAWEQGAWREAADALVARAKLEREPEVLKMLCYRLGMIYADRLVDIPLALAAFQRALTFAPDDEASLVRLVDLAISAGEWKLASTACERLLKVEADPDRRAAHYQRFARIAKEGFGDPKRAERALNLAVDEAPTNDDALTALVDHYRDAGDMLSMRVHLNRIAGTMRARVEKAPTDGVASRVISRAMAARAAAGVPGSLALARSAAELAEILGAAGEPEARLLAEPPRGVPAALREPQADTELYPDSVPTELRQMFQLLGDNIAKLVGTDLRPYGVTRGDRLRARDNEVAAAAQEIATALGFGEIDVYVSKLQPYAMAAEPTSPVSLVIGAEIAGGAFGGTANRPGVRFAAGAALKLAQSSLAIAARMPPDELGVMVIALLRLFQPEFPAANVSAEALAAPMQKLRRLIPTRTFTELRPYALAVDGQTFDHHAFAQGLATAALRAGLIASGSLTAGLAMLAAKAGQRVAAIVGDPSASGLIQFAVSEHHAVVAGLTAQTE